MRYRTDEDVNDGFGDRTGVCRENTLPRDDPNSVIKIWINGHTGFGPVLRVKPPVILTSMESRFSFRSTSGNGATSWVVISRGSNRHVLELRYYDPNHSPENFEEATFGVMRKLMRNCRLLNRDFRTISPNITFLLMKESGLISLPMRKARKNLKESVSRKWVTQLVRNFVLKERESDTAVHRKSDGSEATICVPERWRRYLL